MVHRSCAEKSADERQLQAVWVESLGKEEISMANFCDITPAIRLCNDG